MCLVYATYERARRGRRPDWNEKAEVQLEGKTIGVGEIVELHPVGLLDYRLLLNCDFELPTTIDLKARLI